MVSYIPPELSISKRDVFLDKVDSVGIPLNGLKVIIDGANSDTGEILISGPSITSGYYNDNSADIFKDGYLRTGDIGFIDPDGYIFVTGRKKNIVIVQGMNVQIEEIEQILRSYEPVEDVKVYGKPDEFSGE